MKELVRLCAVLVFVTTITTAGFTQERVNLNDALNYFPDGVYRSFGACDLVAARTADAYPAYQQLFGGGRGDDADRLLGGTSPIPAMYLEQADYYAYAKSVKIKVEAEPQAAAETPGEKRGAKDSKRQQRFDFSMSGGENQGGAMWVFSIPGLSALVEEDVKAGTFVRIGRRLMKRPVYSLRGGEGGAAENALFAYATAADKLLVADSPAAIRAMVRTGIGAGLRMIDNQEYADLFGYIGELGQIVVVRSIRASLRPVLDEATESETLRQAEAASKLVFEIENVYIDDGITLRKQAVFTDEDSAESHYATYRSYPEQPRRPDRLPAQAREDMPQEQRRMLRLREQTMNLSTRLMESQKASLDGVVVTTTITLSKNDLRELAPVLSFLSGEGQAR